MKEGRCKVLDVDAVIAICVCVYVLRTRVQRYTRLLQYTLVKITLVL